jgi:hypothetical protein
MPVAHRERETGFPSMSLYLLPELDHDPSNGRCGPTGLRKKFLEHGKDIPYQTALRRDAAVSLTLDSVLHTAVPGPDIQWHPSYETYLNRVSALASCCLKRPLTLPDGYPSQIETPWVWSGPDLDEQSYILHLKKEDIREIEQALSFFKGNN